MNNTHTLHPTAIVHVCIYITKYTTPHNAMLVRRNAQYMYLCGISEFEIYWNKLLA